MQVSSRYGVACHRFVYPGTTPNPNPPPLSYSVKDIAKPGVPTLTADESAVLRRIRRYVHSETLRFAWVSNWKSNDFIVYDATDGPCANFALGYEVLNGPCDVFYEPGENPYSTHPGPPRESRVGVLGESPYVSAEFFPQRKPRRRPQ